MLILRCQQNLVNTWFLIDVSILHGFTGIKMEKSNGLLRRGLNVSVLLATGSHCRNLQNMSDNLWEIDFWKNPNAKCAHGNIVFCNTCVANHMLRNIPYRSFDGLRNMNFSKKPRKDNCDDE